VGRLHIARAVKRLALVGALLFGGLSAVATASSWVGASRISATMVGSRLRLAVTPSRAAQGQTVTFTATLKFGAAHAPAGTRVTFAVDGVTVASAATTKGVATVSTSTLAGGRHVVAATYSGSATATSSRASRQLIVACPGGGCESLLADPWPAVGTPVRPGQTLTIVAMDDAPLGSLAPSAVLSTGESLVVTTRATHGQAPHYVDANGGSTGGNHQRLLSFTLPGGLAPGKYTILVTAYDTEGDADQWYWPIRIPGTALPYRIGGTITTPLYPGASPSPIDLSFSNPNAGGTGAAGVRVFRIVVRIAAVSAPAATAGHPCAASNFAVTQFSGTYPFEIQAGSSTLQSLGFAPRTWPTVRLVNRPVNQDACMGATVTLAYRGSP